jgi:hypothetical protein
MAIGDTKPLSASASAAVVAWTFALGSIALAACGPHSHDAPSRSLPSEPASAASRHSLASGAQATAPAPSASASPPACQLRLPDPPATVSSPGPVYVLAKHSGVLRIDDTGATAVKPMTDRMSLWNTSVVPRPNGELWTSDWKGVTVFGPEAGRARAIRAVKDGPLYEHLAVRSPTDIWAVTSDSEWSLVHFDGKAWSVARERRQFPGKYEDNKLDSLQTTSDAVWISTWNGIWRGAGGKWEKLESPGEPRPSAALFVYRDRLVAVQSDGIYLREGTAWRRLDVPSSIGHVWAVSDLGLLAAGDAANRRVMLASAADPSCVVTSEPLRGGVIHDIGIDGAGRSWVATDFGLAVLDRSARVLAEWAPGTLDGLSGEVWRVAVASAGPLRLPSVKAARHFDVVGRMVTYKSGSPLAQAALELCPSADEESGCAGAPFARSATVAADGSFRFQDVPDGDLHIHVHPPAQLGDCEGIFRVKGSSFSPTEDCKAWTEAGRVCDVGTLRQCLPFEMPPPR